MTNIRFSIETLNSFQEFLKTIAPDPESAKAFCCAYIGIDDAMMVNDGMITAEVARDHLNKWNDTIKASFEDTLKMGLRPGHKREQS